MPTFSWPFGVGGRKGLGVRAKQQDRKEEQDRHDHARDNVARQTTAVKAALKQKDRAERIEGEQRVAEEVESARARHFELASEFREAGDRNAASELEEVAICHSRADTIAAAMQLHVGLALWRQELEQAHEAEQSLRQRWQAEMMPAQLELQQRTEETQSLRIHIQHEERAVTWHQGEESHAASELQKNKVASSEQTAQARSESQALRAKLTAQNRRSTQLSAEVEQAQREANQSSAAAAKLRNELAKLVEEASINPDDVGAAPAPSDAVGVRQVWQLQAQAGQAAKRVRDLTQLLIAKNVHGTEAAAGSAELAVPSETCYAKPASAKLKDDMKARAAACKASPSEQGRMLSPAAAQRVNEAAYLLQSSPSPSRAREQRSPDHQKASSASRGLEYEHRWPPASHLVAENRRLRSEAESFRRSIEQAKADREALLQEEMRSRDPLGHAANASRARLRGVMREQLQSSRELLAEMRQDVELAVGRVQSERQHREEFEEKLLASELAAGWSQAPPALFSLQAPASTPWAPRKPLVSVDVGGDDSSCSSPSSSSP